MSVAKRCKTDVVDEAATAGQVPGSSTQVLDSSPKSTLGAWGLEDPLK